MRLRLAIAALLLAPLIAVADPVDVPPSDLAGLLDNLPERTLKKLRRSPDGFIEDAAGLIMGYGDGARIGATGIGTYVAVRRAQVRAREMRRMLLADLDDNGTVTEDELSVLIRAASAASRGRLLLGFRKADGDADGVLRMEEMRQFARLKALEAMSDSHAEALFGLLELDWDGDGMVLLDEVVETVRMHRESV